MQCPTRVEGRWRGSPKGGNRGAGLGGSAVATGYGDLNEGSGPDELDSGTDAGATVPRRIEPVRSDPELGDARVQERWIPVAMTMGVRVSEAR